MPAQATANSVIASAKRLIDVRHSWRSSSRIAEISVPAWPIPIHQTKLMIAKPQATGMLTPQMPTPVSEQPADRDQQQHRPAANADAEADEPPAPALCGRVSTMRADLVGDRCRRCGPAPARGGLGPRRLGGRFRRSRAMRPHALPHARDWGCGPAPGRSCAGGVELGEQAVIVRLGLAGWLTWLLRVVHVAEDDGLGRAGRLAGRHDLAVADRAGPRISACDARRC